MGPGAADVPCSKMDDASLLESGEEGTGSATLTALSATESVARLLLPVVPSLLALDVATVDDGACDVLSVVLTVARRARGGALI